MDFCGRIGFAVECRGNDSNLLRRRRHDRKQGKICTGDWSFKWHRL